MRGAFKLFFFLGVISLGALAAPLKLSSHTFQLSIRPQLVGINQDFRQILGNFPGYPEELFQLSSSLDRGLEVGRSLAALCPTRLAISCQMGLQSLLQELRTQERLLLKMQERLQFLPENDASPLAGLAFALSYEKLRARLQHEIELALMVLTAHVNRPNSHTASITKKVDELAAYHDLMLVEFIPPRFKDDFRSAWMNFFRPLLRYGRAGTGHTFMANNIESLNFYWNLLNMRMTKRTKNLPAGISSPLNAIQNRWNQVMRICQGL